MIQFSIYKTSLFPSNLRPSAEKRAAVSLLCTILSCQTFTYSRCVSVQTTDLSFFFKRWPGCPAFLVWFSVAIQLVGKFSFCFSRLLSSSGSGCVAPNVPLRGGSFNRTVDCKDLTFFYFTILFALVALVISLWSHNTEMNNEENTRWSLWRKQRETVLCCIASVQYVHFFVQKKPQCILF